MRSVPPFAVAWLPLGIAITGMCLLVYATVQQNYRQSLNDPQIQLAEDTARIVAAGVPASVLIADGGKIDIDASLSPWLVMYDAQGAPLASSALLNNTVPQIPAGVFDTARAKGENRITWQPEPGVREAIVVVAAGEKGFAVAGRNMREVEARESSLSLFVFAAWAAIMLATLAAYYVSPRIAVLGQ